MARLARVFGRREPGFGVLYGRRRCGKSRLLQEALPPRSIYYVGDDRESALQRAALAAEIARRIPAFDRVTYPEWSALLERFWMQAGSGTVLALDEFPALVSSAPDLPSILQKQVDRKEKRIHLVVAGSSQRMMQGLVLDRSAPLFGRATEILRVTPLPAGWIRAALSHVDPIVAVEAYSVWGGIPRYWELAADYDDLETAAPDLALSPLGVLHHEPATLLLDDLRDTTQAASILSLIGRGCHRLSEIAARLGKPATSLSRPLQRLVELDLIRREVPFGVRPRDSKRSVYQIADPYLRFWFRFVEPNRSRLEARLVQQVAGEVRQQFTHHVASIWEELARLSVPGLHAHGQVWGPASRWWGAGLDRKPMEIDVVAESADHRALLLGEAAWSDEPPARLLKELERKAESFPHLGGRRLFLAVWLKGRVKVPERVAAFAPQKVLQALL